MSSTTLYIEVVLGLIILVLAIALFVVRRRKKSAKTTEEQREGALVQELAGIAAESDPQAAVAAAPTPEAAAAVAAAATAEGLTPPPAGAQPVSLAEPPSAEPVLVPTSVDVPVPDATAPAPEFSSEPDAAAGTEVPVAVPVATTTVVAATKMITADDAPTLPVEAHPVDLTPAAIPVPETLPAPVAAAVLPQPEPEPTPEPMPAGSPDPLAPVNETTQAAALVAERLRKLADEVEREARTSSDGFRVFDVVLDGFAALPVGLLLPEDEAIAATSALRPPSSLATQLRAPQL